MQTLNTSLKLSAPMLRAATELAGVRGVSVAQVLRDALAAEVRRAMAKDRALPSASRPTPTPDLHDEEGVIDF